jgi:hypothetical protein
MGHAVLGFAGGPSVTFRIDPENIDWNYQIITNVIETVGGRVVQVIGAYLNNLTISGSFGQDHSTRQGESWRQAEAFLKLITAMMEYQSRDSNQQDKMSPPAVFSYPPRGWRFQCYIDSLTDASGSNSIIMTPGKINQQYVLSLFIVQDASEGLVVAGTSNGVLNKKAEQAINAYMARIADGIGWQSSVYTGVPAPGGNAPTGKKPSRNRVPPGGVPPTPHGKPPPVPIGEFPP